MITVSATPVHAPESALLLREYITELIVRWYGRPARPEEVAAEIPDDWDLGLFLVARNGSEPVGCVGLRRLEPEFAELKRLYVRPSCRGQGVARQLVAAAENAAQDWGATAIRLDTRDDLVEARALYLSSGFVEIPAYNDDPYAQRWFEKKLAG